VGAQSTPYLESRLGGKGAMDTSRQKANKTWKRDEQGVTGLYIKRKVRKLKRKEQRKSKKGRSCSKKGRHDQGELFPRLGTD